MYKAEISNDGQNKMQVKTKNYSFCIDTKGECITPPDTLLASLGSCIGVYVNKYIQGAKINSKGFKIIVSSDFSSDKPIRFKDIRVDIELRDRSISEDQKKSLMRFIENCPVHSTLRHCPNITFSLM